MSANKRIEELILELTQSHKAYKSVIAKNKVHIYIELIKAHALNGKNVNLYTDCMVK